MVCQAILTGALRHVTERRLQETQQDHIGVKLTAVISGGDEPISSSQKLERTHQHILDFTPPGDFLSVRHSKLPLDYNALSVVSNAMANRPMEAVMIGYAGEVSATAKAVHDFLHPTEGSCASHSVADFGRFPLAPLHDASAVIASAALSIRNHSRYNFSIPMAKVTRAAKCPDHRAKQALNVTTNDLNLNVAMMAHKFLQEMSSRPDEYYPELSMFASDKEKASMYSSDNFFLTALGKAEKEESTGSASQLQEAFETTQTNMASAVGQRIKSRREAAVNIAAVVKTAPPTKQPPPATRQGLGGDSDSDEEVRAGAQYLRWARQNATVTAGASSSGSWTPHPEGTMYDAIVALAVTGTPSAIVSFSPGAEQPFTQITEWDDGTFPPPMGDAVERKTSTLSRTYVPAGPGDPDEHQRGNLAVAWMIGRYPDEHHEGWTVLLSRQGRDGRFSFATFVHRTMASPPASVEAEARQLQVEQSLDGDGHGRRGWRVGHNHGHRTDIELT